MFSSQPKQDQWRCKLIYFSLSHAALDWKIRSPCSERISLIAIHLLEFLFSEFGSKRFDVLLSVGGFSRPSNQLMPSSKRRFRMPVNCSITFASIGCAMSTKALSDQS